MSKQTIDLKTSFLRVLLPGLVIYSGLVSIIFVWYDYKNNEEARKKGQALVFESFVSSIRQPLLQGSTIEVQIRATELLNSKQVLCLDLKTRDQYVLRCDKDLSDYTTSVIEQTIGYGPGSTEKYADLKIAFDNSDLKRDSFGKLIKTIGTFVFQGCLLLLILSFSLKRIRKELSKVLKQAQGEGDWSGAGFRILEFQKLSENLDRHMRAAAEHAESKAALEVSQQVSHDIRSPMAALKAVLRTAEGELKSSTRDTLKFAVQRIADVSNDLARKRDLSVESKSTGSPSIVNLDLSEVVAEKRVQYPEEFVTFIEAPEFSPAMVIKVLGSDFRRIVSNVLDNAVQALAGKGQIEVELRKLSPEFCEIRVSDDGIGIPKDVLPKLFNRGATFGKPGGKGYGLSWSKEVLEKVGGSIKIDSVQNLGTTVIIVAPIDKSPWHVSSIELKPDSKILVIDDDKSVYHAWLHRFERQRLTCELRYHDGRGPLDGETMSWADLCFFDFDLGKDVPTGLSLIKNANAETRSILVTSQYEREFVRRKAQELGVRILPKGLIESIEINLVSSQITRQAEV